MEVDIPSIDVEMDSLDVENEQPLKIRQVNRMAMLERLLFLILISLLV